MKNRYYKVNKEIENKAKTKCSMCGESAKCCLEFHHTIDKKYTISQAVKTVPTDLFIEEINKCIVLCANCHRKLHAWTI